jgi:quinolinate synthase
MTEAAAILNPCKKVLIPDNGAICQNMKLQTTDKVKKMSLKWEVQGSSR